jgi:hypothetical protein
MYLVQIVIILALIHVIVAIHVIGVMKNLLYRMFVIVLFLVIMEVVVEVVA